ncbi:MAG: type II toxin-antitoxin system HicA family toxin [Planctomycetaceae bacterium]|nr:type II toxin-antitoxin system HicA family toxin [Planctomycetaceae bacterium]
MGCRLLRDGGSHSIWENPAIGRRVPIPRHRMTTPPPRSVASCEFLNRLRAELNAHLPVMDRLTHRRCRLASGATPQVALPQISARHRSSVCAASRMRRTTRRPRPVRP